MDLKKITDIIGFSKTNPEDSLPSVKKIETEESKTPPAERVELLNWSIDIESIYIPKRYKSTIVILGSLFLIYLILNKDYIFVITLLSMLFLFNVGTSFRIVSTSKLMRPATSLAGRSQFSVLKA